MKLNIFILFLSLFYCLFITRSLAYDCIEKQDLNEIRICIESLPPTERSKALLDSMNKINELFKTDPLTWEEMHFSVSLQGEAGPLTGPMALELYRKIESLFHEQFQVAQKANKKLIFLGGEEHNNRSDLLLGLLMNHVAFKAGVRKYGFEVADESLIHGTGPLDTYLGLIDVFEVLNKDLETLPSEHEPLPRSYLEGVRHNREFELWHLLKLKEKVGPDFALFSADPMFWNWAKYPNHFGYYLSREPLMVTTLIDQTEEEQAIVAIYGRIHFKGINDLFMMTGLSDLIHLAFLNFGQSLTVYNTKYTNPLEKERWIQNQKLALYEIKNMYLPSNHVLMNYQGPKTAQEAWELFQYVINNE